jgi:hypothetical protein
VSDRSLGSNTQSRFLQRTIEPGFMVGIPTASVRFGSLLRSPSRH